MFKLIRRIFLILIIIAIYNFYPQILSLSGNLLISDDMPQKASAIVIMSGDDSVGSRVKRGIELLNKGYAPFIIVSGARIGWNTYESEIMMKQIKHGKISNDKIIALNSESDSTISEANKILQYCRRKNIKSILVVTSDYHTRRTSFTFKNILDNSGTDVFVTGAKNIRFDPAKWWKSRRYAKTFFLEACKLIWYYTAEKFFLKDESKKAADENVTSLFHKLDNRHIGIVAGSFSGADNSRISAVS